MREHYRIRVTKDFLVFSAGHFITFARDQCERLHGHNYRVEAEVAGPLDENWYVCDFIALRDHLQAIVRQLDHRMLLPTASPLIQVEVANGEVTARFARKRWVFPEEDCLLLPIANTTTELLANWIGKELWRELSVSDHAEPEELLIRVDENHGQWAECRMTRR